MTGSASEGDTEAIPPHRVDASPENEIRNMRGMNETSRPDRLLER